jgi:hypothetical protein
MLAKTGDHMQKNHGNDVDCLQLQTPTQKKAGRPIKRI